MATRQQRMIIGLSRTRNAERTFGTPVIQLTKRVAFKRCKSEIQQCVHCGTKMGKTMGLIMTNKGDGLSLNKNLWLHVGCISDFAGLIITQFDKYKDKIIAEEL